MLPGSRIWRDRVRRPGASVSDRRTGTQHDFEVWALAAPGFRSESRGHGRGQRAAGWSDSGHHDPTDGRGGAGELRHHRPGVVFIRGIDHRHDPTGIEFGDDLECPEFLVEFGWPRPQPRPADPVQRYATCRPPTHRKANSPRPTCRSTGSPLPTSAGPLPIASPTPTILRRASTGPYPGSYPHPRPDIRLT